MLIPNTQLVYKLYAFRPIIRHNGITALHLHDHLSVIFLLSIILLLLLSTREVQDGHFVHGL